MAVRNLTDFELNVLAARWSKQLTPLGITVSYHKKTRAFSSGFFVITHPSERQELAILNVHLRQKYVFVLDGLNVITATSMRTLETNVPEFIHKRHTGEIT